MNADKRGSEEIAKIAGLPPQQAKTGLAGDPGIAKIAEIGKAKISPRRRGDAEKIGDRKKQNLTADERG